jgi:hypothetical protein
MTELELVRRQLLAIRDLVDTTLGIVEDGTVVDGALCLHPREQRTPAAVMGAADRFFCRACQTFVQTSAIAAAPTAAEA